MSFNIYSLYRVLQPRFRAKRSQLFLEQFRPGPTTTILDIGGNVYDWIHLPISSRITILNVAPTDSSPEYEDRFTYTMGDGRNLPFPDQSFDIVYSNSVIEHLRTFEDQRLLAQEALRVGRGVFVQTPNRWFPVEPHFLTVFVHYFPKKLQRLLLPILSLRGRFRKDDDVEMEQLMEELRLLSPSEMKAMFPDCSVCRERVLGFTKSLIAIRTSAVANNV